jgi:PLP dependent protein
VDADQIRRRYQEIQAQAPGVTVVAATKYVSVGDMATLIEAGIEVVGENKAQDLERKHAEYGDAFRWHFIGHLQSNKAKVVNRICELVHSLSSVSAARKLTVPALVEVNLSGEPTKSGVAPEELDDVIAAAADVRGLMTMPPLAGSPDGSRPYFRRLRELAEARGLRELSMGTSQDYAAGVEEGATLIRVGSTIWKEKGD